MYILTYRKLGAMPEIIGYNADYTILQEYVYKQEGILEYKLGLCASGWYPSMISKGKLTPFEFAVRHTGIWSICETQEIT